MPETAAPEIKVLRRPKEQKVSGDSGASLGGKPPKFRGSRAAAAARASPPADQGGSALVYRPEVSASGEMPSIKLVGVQDKEERKKGAPGYWGAGSGQRAAFAAARGGFGSGGGFFSFIAAQTARNLGGTILMAAAGLAAAGFGMLKATEYQALQDAQKTFAKKDREKVRASVAPAALADRPMGGNSLSLVTGSPDGKTQAERDKEAADAAARAKAAAEAKAKEEADAKAQADAAAKAADPNAALQVAMAGQAQPQAPAQAKGLAHGSIGALSTSPGGAGGPVLNGGAGMSGGITGSFGNAKFDANKLLAMKIVPQAAKTSGPAAAAYKGVGRGKALRQLDKVAHYSNLALNGANESRSSNASAPFDNSVPGGDRLTGAGAQSGMSPKDSAPDASPAPNTPGQEGGNPLTNTSPDDGLTDCGNGVRAPAGQCPQVQTGHSVDPTDAIVQMLHILMAAVAVLGVIQLVLTYAKNSPWTAYLYATWLSMANVIGALGTAICALGITLMTMGRPIMGGICAAIGAVTAVLAWTGDHFGFTGYSAGLANVAMGAIGTFLKNPDHKEADPNNPGQLRDGGGGWF